jgi:ABC-type Na+ efflux pump permease subunit
LAVLQIAWHEIGRSGVTRPPILLGALAAALLLGIGATVVDEISPDPDEGLFTARITGPSPFAEVVARAPELRLVAASDPGTEDLHIVGTSVHYTPGDARSEAAYAALQAALDAWLDEHLAHEADVAAAYPILVRLQIGPVPAADGGADGTVTSATTTSAATTNAATTNAATVTATATMTKSTTAAPGTTGTTASPPEPRADAVTPADLEPPFPARSLLLTFAYMVPMNFVAQLYAGALHAERTQAVGRMLLSAPVAPASILFGRSVPYALVAVFIVVAASWWIGTGLAGVAAALVAVTFVMAAAMLAGLTARSPRELTFLLVAVTTGLSTFLFLPAMFPSLPPIAFLSPMAVVSAGIRGEVVSIGAFLYATVPLALSTVALALLATSLYREEALFSPRTLMRHVTDAVHARTLRPSAWFVAGVLAVPFAIAIELFVIGVSIPLGLAAAIPAVLLGTAFVEEALKGLPAIAHARAHVAGRATADGATAAVSSGAGWWRRPALLGVGFFLGEKMALVLGLVGFPDLPMGNAALATLGVGGWSLLLAPLALHVGTAVLTSALVRMRPERAMWLWLPSGVLHASYNAILMAVAV